MCDRVDMCASMCLGLQGALDKRPPMDRAPRITKIPILVDASSGEHNETVRARWRRT